MRFRVRIWPAVHMPCSMCRDWPQAVGLQICAINLSKLCGFRLNMRMGVFTINSMMADWKVFLCNFVSSNIDFLCSYNTCTRVSLPIYAAMLLSNRRCSWVTFRWDDVRCLCRICKFMNLSCPTQNVLRGVQVSVFCFLRKMCENPWFPLTLYYWHLAQHIWWANNKIGKIPSRSKRRAIISAHFYSEIGRLPNASERNSRNTHWD